MPHPHNWSSALLLAAFLYTGLGAQETPPPAEEAALALTFKHRAGQSQRFKGTTKFDLAVSPEGGPAGIGPVPFSSSSVLTFTEKVTGTRQGTGTLALTVNALVTTVTDPLGRKLVLKAQNGKLTTSVDGKPVTAGSAAERQAQLAELRKPSGFRRSPTGMITQTGASNVLGQMFGSATFTILQLPEMPVKVGDTWETVQKIRPTLAGGRAPIVIPEIEFRYTHTLKRIDVRGGKKQALIESSGSGATVGEGSDNSLNQSITGVTRFDIARGAVASSQYNIVLGMRLGVADSRAAAAGVTNMRIDGTMDVMVRELPPAAPKK